MISVNGSQLIRLTLRRGDASGGAFIGNQAGPITASAGDVIAVGASQEVGISGFLYDAA